MPELLVSVVVATRDRPEDLSRFLDSAARLEGVPFEVVIADQSRGRESEVVCCRSTLSDRIQYLKCDPRGKSYAVNRAVLVARGGMLALTDDDCTPDPHWLRRAIDIFASRPYLDLLFGEFVPKQHDPAVEYVPSYHIVNRREYPTIPRSSWASGLGGNTIISRTAFDAVGGMDEKIGPGALFKSGNDYDLNYRVVAAGFIAADEPGLVVDHWGGRSWADGSAQRLRRNNYFGGGAMYAKRLKCGDLRGLAALWQESAIEARTAAGAALRLRRPSGLGRLSAMYAGFVQALFQAVDRETGTFSREPGS